MAPAVSNLRRTPLYDRQVAHGARFVDFGGWELPVQFSSISDEHRAVRTSAGIFDVSHMGQLEIRGPAAHEYLQARLSNDLDRIGAGEAQYTLLTNEQGGILDDLIAYRDDDGYLLVVNAANTEADAAVLAETSDVSERWAMLAVQGPEALQALDATIEPFSWRKDIVLGIDCLVAGTGYTGEDGCELLCSPDDAPALWDAIVARGVTPCGLGARDILRLEVCYPLHGQDITPETDPFAASLGWAVRTKTEFTGVERLREIKEDGPAEKLVPFEMVDRAIPRPGMSILHLGRVTSGGHSPMLKRGIGLGYVASEHAELGSELVIDVRGNERCARIVARPIYRPQEEQS